jgi:hypothetical protein
MSIVQSGLREKPRLSSRGFAFSLYSYYSGWGKTQLPSKFVLDCVGCGIQGFTRFGRRRSVDTCGGANTSGDEFERLTEQIADLDVREAEILALPGGEAEVGLAGLREQRDGLKAELEELWARRSNSCCGGE